MRPVHQRWLGLVLLLLGLLTVGQGILYGQALRRIVACQSEVSSAFSDALEARSAASSDAQQSMDTLIKSIGANLSNPNSSDRDAQLHQAINDYLTKRAAADAQQAQHPFPPPPRDICK